MCSYRILGFLIMQKYLHKSFFICCLILPFVAFMSFAESAFSIPEPDLNQVDAYILIDAQTGTVLAEKNANVRRDPASLTKMMTSYVVGKALSQGRIKNDDVVIVSKNASRATNSKLVGSSLMFLRPNEKVKVSELNKGIIIQSGNDACIAMAEHVSGSQNVFVSEMNNYAQKLGLKDTYFQTVHGLDADEQHTTAHDMAFLGKALIQDLPDEYAIYSQKEFTHDKIKQNNRNGLLWETSLAVDGIKTGHTEGAGYNLVASAVQNNMRLISVVMGAKSEKERESESKKLLVWGFRYFESVDLISANKSLVSAKIWYGKSNKVELGSIDPIFAVIPRGEADKLSYQVTLKDKYLTAPLELGAQVGTIDIKLGDKVIDQKPLVALSKVEESGIFGSIWDWICLKIWLLFN